MGKDKKNDGKHTFFGNLLRGAVKTGKTLGIPLLDAISGGKVGDIIKAISGDTNYTEEDREMLIAEMQKDVEHEREITKRWEADSKSQDWLPRNIRPIVVANYTVLVDIVVINGMWGRPLEEIFLPLLLSLAATVTGGYFALREFGKTRK